MSATLAGPPPVLQALLATMFTWGVTALVFGTKQVERKLLDAKLAFAAGAMIFVVAEEPIPEAKRGSPDIAALALMVTLDVALG